MLEHEGGGEGEGGGVARWSDIGLICCGGSEVGMMAVPIDLMCSRHSNIVLRSASRCRVNVSNLSKCSVVSELPRCSADLHCVNGHEIVDDIEHCPLSSVTIISLSF